MKGRRRGACALVITAALGVAGCGESRGDATTTTPRPLVPEAALDPRAVALADVSLVDYGLLPVDARLPRAGLIAFRATNDGIVRHALAVDGPRGRVRTRALAPGERTAIAVRLPPGTYTWYCPLRDHARRGMVGRLRVAE